MKCLFTNIQKRQNFLKLAYFLRTIRTSRVNNSIKEIIRDLWSVHIFRHIVEKKYLQTGSFLKHLGESKVNQCFLYN